MPASEDTLSPSELVDPAMDAPNGTLYLILIQVASRGLTFIGNQILLRFLSPKLLGLSVQLELFSVSVLYFSRESLRVALQRSPQTFSSGSQGQGAKSVQGQVVVNVSYIAIAIGLPLSIVLGYLYLQNAGPEVLQSPNVALALWIYAFATVMELFAEPSFVILQQHQLYKFRARSETLAAILKCLTACASASLFQGFGYSPSVLPFAIGQLSYAFVVLVDYGRTTSPLAQSEGFSLLLKPITNNSQYLWSRFSRSLLSLSATFYGQSIFKQLLTQGDVYVLGFFASLDDQGGFAIASNYGGLAARLFFQPIEEDSRNVFGKLLAGASTSRLESRNIIEALERLSSICHLYGIVTIGSWCFLSHALPVAVRLIIGREWWTPEISQLLTTYCYYIPFMAFNGILDAFVTSLATPAQLTTQSFWMAIFTACYAGAAYFFLHFLELGAQGLVIANIFNMMLRIVWSMSFVARFVTDYNKESLDSIKRHYSGTFWDNTMQHSGTLACGLGISYALRTAFSQKVQSELDVMYALEVLAISGLMLGIAVLAFEYTFIREGASKFLPKRFNSTLDSMERMASQLLPKHLASIRNRDVSSKTKKRKSAASD